MKEIKLCKSGSILEQLKDQLPESEIFELLKSFGIDELLEGGDKTTSQVSIHIIIDGEEDDGGHKAPELGLIEVGDKTYKIETVTTEADMKKGLGERDSLEEDSGMLFDFGSEQESVEFNVAEMKFPIDIIFIDDDDEVIKVAKDCEPGDDIFTCKNVRYVLEVNAGSGIKKGDDVDIKDCDDSKTPIMKVLAPDGSTQMELKGGERIFSRISSRRLIHWAKRCGRTKKDSDYIHLGKLMFDEIKAQDTRTPEYVEVPES